LVLGVFCLAVIGGPAFAQRPGAKAAAKPAAGSYQVANDVSVQGTVLKYTENSTSAPIGTHVLLQTASGNVDVHLGDGRMLKAAKLTLSDGAAVRFVGQNRSIGNSSVFLARLVQVGAQVVAVRSTRGALLSPALVRVNRLAAGDAQTGQSGGPR